MGLVEKTLLSLLRREETQRYVDWYQLCRPLFIYCRRSIQRRPGRRLRLTLVLHQPSDVGDLPRGSMPHLHPPGSYLLPNFPSRTWGEPGHQQRRLIHPWEITRIVKTVKAIFDGDGQRPAKPRNQDGSRTRACRLPSPQQPSVNF